MVCVARKYWIHKYTDLYTTARADHIVYNYTDTYIYIYMPIHTHIHTHIHRHSHRHMRIISSHVGSNICVVYISWGIRALQSLWLSSLQYCIPADMPRWGGICRKASSSGVVQATHLQMERFRCAMYEHSWLATVGIASFCCIVLDSCWDLRDWVVAVFLIVST